MGNKISVNELIHNANRYMNNKEYCDFCKIDTNHKTENHYCNICKKRGQHSAISHQGCKYCLEDHKSEQHICQKCNQLGHIASLHQCDKCDGAHDTYNHQCDTCGDIGCFKKIHDECPLCEGKSKYTHSINFHANYVVNNQDISFEDIKTKYKRCQICNVIVPVIDDKCMICENIVPKYVNCPRDNCNYKMDNFMCNYCPLCGQKILCTQCLREVSYEEQYESMDEHYGCY